MADDLLGRPSSVQPVGRGERHHARPTNTGDQFSVSLGWDVPGGDVWCVGSLSLSEVVGPYPCYYAQTYAGMSSFGFGDTACFEDKVLLCNALDEIELQSVCGNGCTQNGQTATCN